jgi:GTPase SAR1 family protein
MSPHTRFADETFSEEHKPTHLVEYRHRFIDTLNARCKVQIWDCLSSTSPRLMSSIYKGAHGVVLLYDVTNPDTLESAPDWYKEIQSYSSPKVVAYFVGTKTDLDRKVSIEQGQAMAAQLGIKYYEVSSQNGGNVDSLFCKLVNDVKEVNAILAALSPRKSLTVRPRQNHGLTVGADGGALPSSTQEEKANKTRCCIIQ